MSPPIDEAPVLSIAAPQTLRPPLSDILHTTPPVDTRAHTLKRGDILVPGLVSAASYNDCTGDMLAHVYSDLARYGFAFHKDVIDERSSLRAVSFYNPVEKHLMVGFRGTDGNYIKNILYCLAIISKGSAYHVEYSSMLPHVSDSLKILGFTNPSLFKAMGILRHFSYDTVLVSLLSTAFSVPKDASLINVCVRYALFHYVISGQLAHNYLFHLLSRAIDHADEMFQQILDDVSSGGRVVKKVTLTGHSLGGFFARCVNMIHGKRHNDITLAAPGGADFFLRHLYQPSYIDSLMPKSMPLMVYNFLMMLEAVVAPNLTGTGHPCRKRCQILDQSTHLNVARNGDVVGMFMPSDSERIILRPNAMRFDDTSLSETIHHHHKLSALLVDLKKCDSETEL